jgi:hypothetical protein
MDAREAARLEEYYRRWLRPDWRRWLHPDWERRAPPAQRAAMREDFAIRDRAFETPRARRLREQTEAREREQQEALEAEHQAEIEREALKIKAEIAALRYELMWVGLCRKYGYNPSQLRVPAGNPDGGQWTDSAEGSAAEPASVQLAASEKLPIGRLGAIRLLFQVGKRLIDAYRSDNLLFDLFGEKPGVVSTTTLDGKTIYGVNSDSPTYSNDDKRDWMRLRDRFVEKYPDFVNSDNFGKMPLNALTHAETTVLLRAARENGGMLTGQRLEVIADKVMCNFCREVLPSVGMELGDPTVTFIGPNLKPLTMKGGKWITE